MKLLLSISVLAIYASSCGKKKDDPKSNIPVVTIPPSWAGNCDVDYNTLQTDRLERFNVVIEDRGINAQDKIVILNELNSLPDFILQAIGEDATPFHMIDGGITEFERFAHLKGQPMDPENPDYLWDDLAGTVDDAGVWMGTTSHGGNSLSIHEAGHVVDFTVELTLNGQRIIDLYNLYADQPHDNDRDSDYRMKNIYEFFATSFDDYYCSSITHLRLQNLYPELHSYFQDHFEEEITTFPKVEKLSFK